MYPHLSSFEKVLYTYCSQCPGLTEVATIVEMHPNTTGDLADKGRLVIGFLNHLQPCASRLEIDAAYQFTCWDRTFAKARRLNERVIDAVESMTLDVPDLKVLLPIFEGLAGADYSPSTGLYFSSVVYRFPIVKK